MNGGLVIRITKHAAERGEERLKLNHGSLLRMVRAALLEGMPMAETRGDLWRSLEASMLRHGGEGDMTRIHAGVVFVIHQFQLITVYRLPKEHRNQVSQWLAKNPPAAKSSGSLNKPRSGVLTPKPAPRPLKTVKEVLKSPLWGESQAGGGV